MRATTMVDKHITRLVKGADAERSPLRGDRVGQADVIKPRRARRRPSTSRRSSASRPSASPALDVATQPRHRRPASTRCATPESRSSRHYRPHDEGHASCPSAGCCPKPLRDDTGVIFASCVPRSSTAFADELSRYYTCDRGLRSSRLRRTPGACARGLVRRKWRRRRSRSSDLDHRLHELEGRIAASASPTSSTAASCSGSSPMAHSTVRRVHRRARSQHAHQLGVRERRRRAFALAEDWIRDGSLPTRGGRSAPTTSTGDHLLRVDRRGLPRHRAPPPRTRSGRGGRPPLRPPSPRHDPRNGRDAGCVAREPRVRRRGARPAADLVEVLSRPSPANSAFHGTRLDVEHIEGVMDAGGRGRRSSASASNRLASWRPRARLRLARDLHARRAAAAPRAEVQARSARRLRRGRGGDRRSRTRRGFTGHPMGVGIEDVDRHR